MSATNLKVSFSQFTVMQMSTDWPLGSNTSRRFFARREVFAFLIKITLDFTLIYCYNSSVIFFGEMAELV